MPAAADALRREDILRERLDQAVREAKADLPELVAIFGEDRHRGASDRYCQLYAAAFSPDGKTLAVGGRDKIVRLWDVATGKLRAELTGHVHPDVYNLYTLAFSPDGSFLASGDREGTIRLWEPTTGKYLRTLQAPGGTLLQVAFAPDSTVLAAARDSGAVQFWDVRSGELLSGLDAGRTTVYCLAFSPDGRLLATSGKERTIRLWDATKGKLLGELQGHTGDPRCLLFHPDGCILASAGHDKVIRLWDVASRSAIGTSFSFLNPSESLEIEAGSGGDTITIKSLDPAFAADLLIYGNESSARRSSPTRAMTWCDSKATRTLTAVTSRSSATTSSSTTTSRCPR